MTRNPGSSSPFKIVLKVTFTPSTLSSTLHRRVEHEHNAMRRALAPPSRRLLSSWSAVKPMPADPILGMTAMFLEDKDAKKVNLGQGVYRTDEGKPYVLSSIKEAEGRVASELQSGRTFKEYLPIEGDATFRKLSAELVFGAGSAALREGLGGHDADHLGHGRGERCSEHAAARGRLHGDLPAHGPTMHRSLVPPASRCEATRTWTSARAQRLTSRRCTRRWRRWCRRGARCCSTLALTTRRASTRRKSSGRSSPPHLRSVVCSLSSTQRTRDTRPATSMRTRRRCAASRRRACCRSCASRTQRVWASTEKGTTRPMRAPRPGRRCAACPAPGREPVLRL